HLALALFFSTNDPAPPAIYTFPYTTLFRSRRERSRARGDCDQSCERAADPEAEIRADALQGVAGVEPVSGCDRGDQRVVAGPEEDRKSTRLNSSHDQISYAVFCLKKKKKKK